MTHSARPVHFGRDLALTYVFGLLGAFAWVPLVALIDAWTMTQGPTFILYFALLGLAPVPAIAAATLLVRDHGWRRGCYGAPAAVLAAALPGLWHLARIAITEGRPL
ncbi:MAG: hypothetical protein Q8L66_11110 [Caulobacter sp.]|nr:hypothetical protein [Caulobacter sp.]